MYKKLKKLKNSINFTNTFFFTILRLLTCQVANDKNHTRNGTSTVRKISLY